MSIFFVVTIVLVALLLWFIIGARGYTIVKTVSVPVSLYLIVALYYSLTNVLGWATTSGLPKEFELIYAEVQEPIPAFDFKGKITLLVKDPKITPNWFMVYTPPDKENRLYSIPYTKNLGDKLMQAIEALKNGNRVGAMSLDGEGEDEGDGNGNIKGDKNGTGGGDVESDLKFYILPNPKPPRKETV